MLLLMFWKNLPRLSDFPCDINLEIILGGMTLNCHTVSLSVILMPRDKEGWIQSQGENTLVLSQSDNNKTGAMSSLASVVVIFWATVETTVDLHAGK